MHILTGDIGGTKTRLALLELDGGKPRCQMERTYASAAHGALEPLLEAFLGQQEGPCQAVGLGVAGPVREGRCATTNLPWVVDEASLARSLGLPRVRIVNDLEATARGIQALAAEDLHLLHPGLPDPQGNRAVIAAGTGLGEAGICVAGGQWRPFASEGGHADFAPASELEWDLLQFLARRHGHVSWERVVSGLGIVNLYEFLRERQGIGTPDWLARELEAGEGAAAISRAADGERCPVCVQAMNLFVSLYGREAGNQALKLMATGGVYLGGGIAPRILRRLTGPSFLEAFFAKGRMEPLLRGMPVWVIRDDRTALYGAALAALERLEVAG